MRLLRILRVPVEDGRQEIIHEPEGDPVCIAAVDCAAFMTTSDLMSYQSRTLSNSEQHQRASTEPIWSDEQAHPGRDRRDSRRSLDRDPVPNAIWEEDVEQPVGGYWVSDAEVAQTTVTVFTSRRTSEHVTCRLIVRRVKRLNPITPAGNGKPGSVQEELSAAYRHHGFITNSTLSMVEADARHRDHAIVEQVIAELKDGPIAHLPSGSYAANAAWLAHAVIAFNLARTAGVLASKRHARARWATLRTQLVNVPARVASSARRLTLHLPTDWPWAPAWQNLFDAAAAPPRPVLA